MPTLREKLKSTFLGALIKWAAIVFVLILIGFNGANLLLYRKLQPLVTQQMANRLAFNARAISETIRGSWIRSFIADREGIYGSILVEKLTEFKNRGEFTSVTLLDTTGNVIYSSGSGYNEGEYYYYLGIDKGAFEAALQGVSAYTELYNSGGNFIRGAYSPVYDELSAVGWILALEAGAEYHLALSRLKKNAIVFFIVSVIVASLIGVILLSASFELKRMEKNLINASALSSVGKISAGLAHEIRNPLAIIRASTDRLQKDDLFRKNELIAFIQEEIERINEIVEGYLDLARPSNQEKKIIDIAETVQAVANRVKPNLQKKEIELKLDIEDKRLLTNIDIEAFRRSLLNIYLNAIEALDDGCEIQISVKRVSRNRCKITISDNGPGIPHKISKKIFEPFVTTKKTGTGLGLTLTRKVIEDAGGELFVESKQGEGSDFIILLPIYKKVESE